MISGKDIAAEARTWLGTKYHHQGRLKKSYASNGGVDCIGLIMGVAMELRLVGADGKLLAKFDETSYSPHPDGVRLKQFLDLHLKNFEEDKSTISTGEAPLIMSLLRTITLAIIALFSNKITETRENFNNYRHRLFKLFST
ncbi:MAG: hypothetical protein ACEY3E_01265 [Candidatus Tisiphia sp.]